MTINRLDQIYRSILLSKYFVKGWGKPENLKRLFKFRKVVSNRETCFKLVPREYPVTIIKDEMLSDCRVMEGHFRTPFIQHLPGLLPKEAEMAHFQAVFPKKWSSEDYKPVCIHLAGTGDHHFWRRRTFVAKPLLKEAGIGAVILENPFYGSRKPKDQVRSVLHNVSDIFVMGGCLIMECLVLFHWLEQLGCGPLGVTGLSMGGHMASLAATAWPKPCVLVPCLSWSTASGVFTEGVLSGAINWKLLENQYRSDEVYRAEIEKMVTIIEDDAFMAGQEFAKNYPDSMLHVNSNSTMAVTTQVPSMSSGNIITGSINSTLGVPTASIPVNSSELECTLGIGKYKTDMPEPSRNVSHDNNNNNNEIMSTASSSKAATAVTTASVSTFKNIGGLFRINTKTGMNNKLVTTPLGAQDRKDLLQFLNEKLGISSSSKKKRSLNWREHEALHFMRGIMDECTHLRNFSTPVDTSLIIAVCARDDGYVPREGVTNLADIWPGAEVRYLDAGHVSAFILHQKVFRTAIADAFERAKLKYYCSRISRGAG
ncbi:protein ABHD18 isoform X2 [Lycorma delicatula]|uniref:protein ABHD18 isoform X2 n=1 Tax=Lycorma delicatula TaxID=130591 RepID=UPI003F511DFF